MKQKQLHNWKKEDLIKELESMRYKYGNLSNKYATLKNDLERLKNEYKKELLEEIN